MGNKVKDIIFIIVLGSFCIGLLLWVRGTTSPVILRHEELTLKSTILDAAGVKYTPDTVERSFDGEIKKASAKGMTYYTAPDGSYVFEFSGQGLWGPITGVVTMNKDMETVGNIKIIFQEETPGLGSRIAEEAYLAQFRGKKAVPSLELVMRRKASGAREIDAISGASMSSRALVDVINSAISNFREKKGN